MKVTKTLQVLFLVVAISVLLSVAAFASPMRASKYLSGYSARLTKTSNGDLSLYFHVTAPATMDHLGASRIAMQRYTGSYWRTEYNFTYPETPELQDEDVAVYLTTITYTPQYPTSSYRAVITFYAANADGFDTGVYTAD